MSAIAFQFTCSQRARMISRTSSKGPVNKDAAAPSIRTVTSPCGSCFTSKTVGPRFRIGALSGIRTHAVSPFPSLPGSIPDVSSSTPSKRPANLTWKFLLVRNCDGSFLGGETVRPSAACAITFCIKNRGGGNSSPYPQSFRPQGILAIKEWIGFRAV